MIWRCICGYYGKRTKNYAKYAKNRKKPAPRYKTGVTFRKSCILQMSNPEKTKSAVKVGGIALIQSERGSTTKQPEKTEKTDTESAFFY